MAWHRIRMVLARTHDFPDGSESRGYELVAPLTADGHLDEPTWRNDKKRATVQRFWEGEPNEDGNLIHTRHRTWAFSYEPGEDDDEPIFRLETHSFVEGEYMSVTEHDGQTLPFKIVQIQALD